MFRSGAKWLLVAMLALSVGFHWAFLQSVAWAGMIVTYAEEEGSLSAGVAKTFSGEHPCRLCKLVRAAEKSEKAPDEETSSKKFDKAAPAQTVLFVFVPVPQIFPAVAFDAPLRSEPPLLTPPRFA